MKGTTLLCLKTGGLLIALTCSLRLAALPADTLQFDRLLLGLAAEMRASETVFLQKHRELTARLAAADLELAQLARRKNKRYCRSLENKLLLTQALALNQQQREVTMLKIRYRKGIDLIKLMYEKILGLDHHFTGLNTYQNINALSNPNTFPEFQKAKEQMEKRANKRFAMRLPGILQTNPFISATFTMVSLLLGESSQQQKEEDFEKISCILDFTVRMNADLNVIRHETESLKDANQQLMADCERLFQEYTKPLEYLVPLETCRNEDDWESLSGKLDDLMEKISAGLEAEDGDPLPLSRSVVSLEFATQRVSDFIAKYCDFIGQGSQYYIKFDHIISGYQHESFCQQQLPREFVDLKADVKATIDKFNNTYNLPELQGSRLKDLMFGTGE